MSDLTDAIHIGILMAHALGHLMTGAIPDVDEGYIATCIRCSLWLAANNEEPLPWGRVLTTRCSGRVMA